MNGLEGEEGCEGAASMTTECNLQPCPEWGSWSNYTRCTTTCGGGLRTRSRLCINGEPGDYGCHGPVVVQSICNGKVSFTCIVNEAFIFHIDIIIIQTLLQACPYLSSWYPWRSCSVTCGGGIRTRNRICVNGFQGMIGCDDILIESQECNEQVTQYIKTTINDFLLILLSVSR